MRPTAEDPTATGAQSSGTAPGQAASPNGSTATAAAPEPTFEDRLAQAEARGFERARAEGTRAYQGLQRTLSQTQAELTQAKANASKLDLIPAIVRSQQALLERTVGPEEARAFALTLENETLKAERAAAQQPVAQPAAPQPYVMAPQQVVTPTTEKLMKQQVLDNWYPGEGLSADDPKINWASGVADPNEAQRLFHGSVAKVVAARAAEAARASASQEATQSAQELLTRAGAETTDGTLPTGTPAPVVDDNPRNWNPRELIAAGLRQSGDPHAKLEERQARRVGVGAQGGPVVRTQ